MLQHPVNGQQVFEIAIYNKDVRALVKENQSHTLFDDLWADLQLHDVTASSERAARSMISKRFPAEDGFIIEHVIESHI